MEYRGHFKKRGRGGLVDPVNRLISPVMETLSFDHVHMHGPSVKVLYFHVIYRLIHVNRVRASSRLLLVVLVGRRQPLAWLLRSPRKTLMGLSGTGLCVAASSV